MRKDGCCTFIAGELPGGRRSRNRRARFVAPGVCLAAALFGGAPPVAYGLPQENPQFDIRSFGARCDGTDDTRAVQTALNNLPAGGTLTFSCMAGITQVTLSKTSQITLAGVNGGGVILLAQTGDVWAKALAITFCRSCTVRDMVFEGNYKDMIPFNLEESSDCVVSGLTIRNVRHAGAAFLAVHNNGNKYLNNTLQNVGMDRSPGEYDVARGMWVGGASDDTKETDVTISGNSFIDISGTALAVHGSGMTITENTGIRLNWACIKVLPLGGSGTTLVALNNCSGAGARWLIGGGIMTEYYNSSYETTVIRDNALEGYAATDVSRIPDSPNVGINIANPPGKISHNVQVINNRIRNMLYDGIQISGPTENFLIDSNLIERTISTGMQWNGINLQGDSGKVISNGTIKRNLISGKFDGIRLSANGGVISGVTLDSNSVVAMGRDGLHLEVQNGGQVSAVGLTDPCFSGIGRRAVWDNRPKAFQLNAIQITPARRNAPESNSSCADPRDVR